MRLLTALIFSLAASTLSYADEAGCPIEFKDGENLFEETLKAIEAEPDCNKAADIAFNCAWGSGADVSFAGAAREKCEKTMGKFSAKEKATYNGLLSLCQRKYEKMDGTMFRAMAAHCMLSQTLHFKELKKVETPKTWDYGVDP